MPTSVLNVVVVVAAAAAAGVVVVVVLRSRWGKVSLWSISEYG